VKETQEKKLLTQIVSLAAAATDPPPRLAESEGLYIFHHEVGRLDRAALLGEAAQRFRAIVRDLVAKNPTWQRKLSETYIERQIGALVVIARTEGNNEHVQELLHAKIEELDNYSVEQTIWVPLAGIDIDSGELQVGMVKLLRVTETRIERMVEALFLADGSPTGEETDAQISQVRTWLQSLLGTVCAEYRMQAESGKAIDQARIEIDRVLDLLRFALFALQDPAERIGIGRPGELAGGSYPVTVFSSNGTFVSWPNQAGVQGSLKFDAGTRNKLDLIGIFTMANALEAPDEKKTRFQLTVVRAIHWFAVGQMQAEPENAFLNYTTALEALFTPRGRDLSVTNAVADGVAFTLGTDLADRKATKKLVKDLYEVRSRITHGGEVLLTQQNLSQLRYITFMSIQVAIRSLTVFSGKDDLLDWIETRRLS
jgi:hypothetical protein